MPCENFSRIYAKRNICYSYQSENNKQNAVFKISIISYECKSNCDEFYVKCLSTFEKPKNVKLQVSTIILN